MSKIARTEPLRTGTAMGLVRDFCRKCKEVTLHKKEGCVHCGTIRGHISSVPVDYHGRPVGRRVPGVRKA